MIARFPVFSERLATDWAHARQAAEKALYAYSQISADESRTSLYIDATALNLHAFYGGLERIFEWVARQLDSTIPQGGSWQIDLLTHNADE